VFGGLRDWGWVIVLRPQAACMENRKQRNKK